ncbi:MAG: type II toxin-antitoxin system RelE/ParE family toxin [Bacteroidota bacterium]
MNVEYSKSFKRDIETVNDQKVLARLKELLLTLEQVSALTEIQNTKKLKTSGNYYLIKVGDYRIGLKFEENKLTLFRFLHRKEVYRYFP